MKNSIPFFAVITCVILAGYQANAVSPAACMKGDKATLESNKYKCMKNNEPVGKDQSCFDPVVLRTESWKKTDTGFVCNPSLFNGFCGVNCD